MNPSQFLGGRSTCQNLWEVEVKGVKFLVEVEVEVEDVEEEEMVKKGRNGHLEKRILYGIC